MAKKKPKRRNRPEGLITQTCEVSEGDKTRTVELCGTRETLEVFREAVEQIGTLQRALSGRGHHESEEREPWHAFELATIHSSPVVDGIPVGE